MYSIDDHSYWFHQFTWLCRVIDNREKSRWTWKVPEMKLQRNYYRKTDINTFKHAFVPLRRRVACVETKGAFNHRYLRKLKSD